MKIASEDTSNDLQNLRRCINDLVSLLALPAIWTGQEPQQILKTMVDSLQGMLRLDFIYARVYALSGGLGFDATRLAGHHSSTSAEKIRQTLEPWLQGGPFTPLVMQNPVGEGEMHAARLSLGLSEEIGLVIAGSQRQDFPNQTETILLNVAVNQTTIALNGAILASQRRKAEEALARQLTVTRTITDNSAQALFMIGTDGYCTFMNPAAEKMFGFTFDEIRLHPLHEMIHHHWPDGRPYPIEQCPITRAMRAHRNIGDYEDLFIRKNGEFFPVLVESSLIFDKQQHPTAAVLEIKDITEQKQAEKEREEHLEREKALRSEAESANTLKDEFLATISHELRTPLNAMLGWARILRTTEVDPETTGRALEAIERSAKIQAQLIEDLLDVSRIISGKMRLNVQTVDLPLVIQASIESVRPAADAKGIRLQVVIDPEAGPVFGDPTRLQQIVWNLLSNSIKFTSKEGRVQVRLARVNSHVEITVSDTGIGIDPQFLPYVFDRFRQADSTITRSQPGLGLGLAVVRHLVELHGGEVHAYSAGEKKGAMFTVKLPLAVVRDVDIISPKVLPQDQPSVSADASLECPPSLLGLRVLVVDDEPDGRGLLTTILQRCKAEVTAAGSAAEAFKVLDQFKPDVLVCDIQMPDEDGFSFIRKVREKQQNKRVPAAALTAHAGLEYRMRALSAGFDIHLPKPVEPAELVAVIVSLANRIGKGPGA